MLLASWATASELSGCGPIGGLLPTRVAIPTTQRLQKQDGEFAGVVLFSLDPARATALYRRVDLGNSGSLLLIGTDGIVRFGYTLPLGLDPSVIGTLATNENALSGSVRKVLQNRLRRPWYAGDDRSHQPFGEGADHDQERG